MVFPIYFFFQIMNDVNLTQIVSLYFKYSLLFGLVLLDILVFPAAHHSKGSQHHPSDKCANEEEDLNLSPKDPSELVILDVIIYEHKTDWRNLVQWTQSTKLSINELTHSLHIDSLNCRIPFVSAKHSHVHKCWRFERVI